jgi:hypothetical protein
MATASSRRRTAGSEAAREASTTPEAVRKYVDSALRRAGRGRSTASASDRFTRRLHFLQVG